MNFQLWKKNSLRKKDKSKKGSLDEKAKTLVEVINNMENCFTTSSCSGRITLRAEPTHRKKDVKLMLKTHEPLSFHLLKSKLARLPRHKVWLRFEPFILHIACQNMNDALLFLEKARKVFKHSGIISAGKKLMIEVRGSEFLEVPIAANGKCLASEGFLRFLVSEANKKLKENSERIRRFLEEVKSIKP